MNDLTPAALPGRLYRAEQVRAMDRYAIEQLGIPGIELMRRAGAAAFAALRRRWPCARTLSVLCGAGNNGGDGYVLARLALEAGMDVRAYPLSPPDALQGDALAAFLEYREAGGPVLDFVPVDFEGAEVLADGLLGTGLSRPVEGLYAEVIRGVQRFRGGVLALDIPSGLDADTGRVWGVAVKADVTVSFVGLKRGLFTGEGPEHCGERVFDGLSLPVEAQAGQAPSARLLPPWTQGLPRRSRGGHKGHYGHVLVVGGAPGFCGAARMAAEAAARVGAGLVSVATHPEHAALLNAGRPELMCHGVAAAEGLRPLLARASVAAVGPGLGLGQAGWGRVLFEAMLDSGLPLVVDADALNLLALSPMKREDWVLTPHPGEAARLLQTTTAAVQADRFAAVAALQARFGGTVLLKGAGTLIQGPGGVPAVCAQGNPGMASGGMGDVLTGVIAGLLAQGLGFTEAAEEGARLHGMAGDKAAGDGERGLLAGDLMPWLRQLVNL
jgi:NAD(P)H-hydrate epimerase